MKRWTAYLMVAPAVVLAILLWLLPLIAVGGLSLFQSNLLTSTWAGLANYGAVWGQPQWVMALVNSCVFAAIFVVGNVGGGLLIALPASTLARSWRNGLRIALYVPILSAGIIIGQFWLWIFRGSGVANWFLGLFGVEPLRWLTERWLAIPVIGVVVMSCIVGGQAVIFITMLEGVPREQREAARMDGASRWQTWRVVDIPHISKTILVLAFLAMVAGFGVWETPYVLTRGGPEGATASVMYAIWTMAFEKQEYGMAATQSILMLAIVTAVLLVSRRLAK